MNLVDLEHILQHEYLSAKSASIQPRRSPLKFGPPTVLAYTASIPFSESPAQDDGADDIPPALAEQIHQGKRINELESQLRDIDKLVHGLRNTSVLLFFLPMTDDRVTTWHPS